MEDIIEIELASKRWFGLGLLLKRKQLLELIQKSKQQENTNLLLQLELNGLRSSHETLQAEHSRQRKGVGTLLQFIHSTHRLNLPVSNGTILSAITRKGEQR